MKTVSLVEYYFPNPGLQDIVFKTEDMKEANEFIFKSILGIYFLENYVEGFNIDVYSYLVLTDYDNNEDFAFHYEDLSLKQEDKIKEIIESNFELINHKFSVLNKSRLPYKKQGVKISRIIQLMEGNEFEEYYDSVVEDYSSALTKELLYV